jgi:hypothetical protein
MHVSVWQGAERTNGVKKELRRAAMTHLCPTQTSTSRLFFYRNESTHCIMLLAQINEPQQTQECSALVGNRGVEGCAGVWGTEYPHGLLVLSGFGFSGRLRGQ